METADAAKLRRLILLADDRFRGEMARARYERSLTDDPYDVDVLFYLEGARRASMSIREYKRRLRELEAE